MSRTQEKNIKIGQRVLLLMNGMIGIVVGKPEYYSSRVKVLKVKYENSTRYEFFSEKQVEVLPIEEQYPAHGGSYANV